MTEMKNIKVRGAREHNLKSVDIDIPRNKLVVITGVSGSGKSSLAIDTVYAEGQRRYVESLSAYARQFLQTMEKPDVDHIEGLSPAISIEQKTTSRNPRSTVATITEIHDYLRLLFARTGTPHSPLTGEPIVAQQISDMTDRLMELEPGTRIHLLAPVVRDRKGSFRTELEEFRKKGFLRVRIDGSDLMLDNIPDLMVKNRHDIDLVVDRLVIGPGIEERLADSLRTGLDMAEGIVCAELIGRTPPETITFSENFACPVSGFTVPKLEPRMFSFNTHAGACSACDGLGHKKVFTERKILRPDLPLKMAFVPAMWKFVHTNSTALAYFAKCNGLDPNTPWKELPPRLRKVVLYGLDEDDGFSYADGIQRGFGSVIPNLRLRYDTTQSANMRTRLEQFMELRKCEKCKGFRLSKEALSVRIAGIHLGQLLDQSILEALEWISGAHGKLGQQQQKIAEIVLKEIADRLGFLVSVGLEYLTLSRSASTLSGGESQRIRLASQIGAGLTGVLYVLDEPSIGLHQRDNRRLLDSLESLRDRGNTVVVVEHDEEAIRTADHVIDMGPGAGIHGGTVVAAGPPEELVASPNSITAQYLRGEREIAVPERRRTGNGSRIRVRSANTNNLKNVDVDIPLGKLVCVTGVSGSGKSSLIKGTLIQHINKWLWRGPDFGTVSYRGQEKDRIQRSVEISQRPIGRTPRSCPATYTKVLDPIRNWYAKIPESKQRGYTSSRYSFNVKGGRCENCKGEGVLKISMLFLPDVYVTCESCNGQRYNRETLAIKYRNKNISDVLKMTVEEACSLFAPIPNIHEKLLCMDRVGLGYMRLGHPSPMLSGGEAQRIKLARELGRPHYQKSVFFLDEPTTGLHFDDIRKLMLVLHELVDLGHSVIIIEHNLDVIKTADWIIDLGPEGGDRGGWLVCDGTPEAVARNTDSYTGHFLAPLLGDRLHQAA